jgi:molybdopterin converting factor small subunit
MNRDSYGATEPSLALKVEPKTRGLKYSVWRVFARTFNILPCPSLHNCRGSYAARSLHGTLAVSRQDHLRDQLGDHERDAGEAALLDSSRRMGRRATQHIGVFVGNENSRYTGDLATPVAEGAGISILPAVSGG